MKKLILTILFAGSLTACMPQYGNYTKISDADNIQMADDSARKLNALYPPASTHLTLLQTPQDAYGIELVKKLRESGYAITEGNELSALFTSAATVPTTPSNAAPSNKANPHSKSKVTGSSAPASSTKVEASTAAPGSDKPFGYIVDELGEGLYRITLSIDSKALSRVYTVSSKGLVPAGSWTRKEE